MLCSAIDECAPGAFLTNPVPKDSPDEPTPGSITPAETMFPGTKCGVGLDDNILHCVLLVLSR